MKKLGVLAVIIVAIIVVLFSIKNFRKDTKDVIPNEINKQINEELLNASIRGNIETVQTLLDKGADVNAKNNGGYTALWWASFNGHADIVKLLIENGADINVKAKRMVGQH